MSPSDYVTACGQLRASGVSRTPSRGARSVYLTAWGDLRSAVDMRLIWCRDGLPGVRAFMTGRRWRALCGVEEVIVAERLDVLCKVYHPGEKILLFTLEEDVRELVTRGGVGARAELRPGIFADWDDEGEAVN